MSINVTFLSPVEKETLTNGQTGSDTMSILKDVMVDFRAWNNCLVALNMYKWGRCTDNFVVILRHYALY